MKDLHAALLDLAFSDITSAYVCAENDYFPELRWGSHGAPEDRLQEWAEAAVEETVITPLREWPEKALEHLGHVLGFTLLHRSSALTGGLVPSGWEFFDDPADVFHGHVFRTLFVPRGYNLDDYSNPDEFKVSSSEKTIREIVGETIPRVKLRDPKCVPQTELTLADKGEGPRGQRARIRHGRTVSEKPDPARDRLFAELKEWRDQIGTAISDHELMQLALLRPTTEAELAAMSPPLSHLISSETAEKVNDHTDAILDLLSTFIE